MNLDLLSFGDATLDVFLTPTESESLCSLDTKECLIAFSYGAKIPVKDLTFSTGGNAANNSIGAKRLGLNTGIVVTIGDDGVGDQILTRLKSEGVDTTFVIQQPETSSTYSTIVNYGGERTIFVYYPPRSYEFPVKLPTPPWIYLTSLGESFKPFYLHIVDYLKRNPSIKMAFNPGSWQLKSGSEGLKDILALTHLIFVNREEAELLTGLTETHGKERDLLVALKNLGPKVCVITDGNAGAFSYDSINGKFLKVGIMPIEAFERTGAGDAFGSGTLAGLVHGKSLDEALLWGTCNSSSVIGYTGSQKGLLTLSEMEVWLERAKSSGVKVEPI